MGHEITHGFAEHGQQIRCKETEGLGESRRLKKFKAVPPASPISLMPTSSTATCTKMASWCRGKACDLGGRPSHTPRMKILRGSRRPLERDGLLPSSVFSSGGASLGANERIEYARLMANTNPHPLPRFRGNGPLSNRPSCQGLRLQKRRAVGREQTCYKIGSRALRIR